MNEPLTVSTEIRTSVWDDLETLVFDRDDVQAAMGAALESIGDDDGAIPVDASALLVSQDDDDEWLATIPAAAFEVLAQASRKLPPSAPRLAFAIAHPAH
ncbi:MAG: hypothetical protein M3Y87_19825 [Myxococcota bacterium]|nr:hypothetical protein [Myxococcota bacterium]